MTMDATTRIKTEAEVLRQMLIYGLAPVSDVVAWADRLIADTEAPGDVLLDLSMAGSAGPKESARLLEGIDGAAEPFEFARMLLSRFYDHLKLKPEQLREIASALIEIDATTTINNHVPSWSDLALLADELFFDLPDKRDDAIIQEHLLEALAVMSNDPRAEITTR